MTTAAAIGHGTLFKILSSGSYVTVAEVTEVRPPSISRDALDATHSESTEKWREFIYGLKDGGEVGADINFVPGNASTTLLLAQFDTDTAASCQISFPNNEVWSFSALLTGFEPGAPVGDKMTASFTFKITGKPTLV